MRELSIFIDESGDFGDYQEHCPFYIISFIFHNQECSITEQVEKLDQFLEYNNLKRHNIHTAPLIRKEKSYKDTDISLRSKLFRQLFNFVRSVDISYKTIVVDKRTYKNQMDIVKMITKELSSFIRNNYSFFQQFENIIVYYDNGQVQLNKTLVAIFGAMFGENIDFRGIEPNNFKLFQAADLICTLELIKNKLSCGKSLTASEQKFFGSASKLRKNYLKFFEAIEFGRKIRQDLSLKS